MVIKNKILTVLFIFVAIQSSGQSVDIFERRLYDSYVEDMILEWQGIIEEMQVLNEDKPQKELLYSMCFAQYGYIGYCIGKDLEDEAKRSLKEARKSVNELERLYDGRHDVLALQGALLGYQIMLSKFSSLYLGPKAFKLINAASASSDTYFNCSLEIGNMRYFTPKFLGGSKEEAIAYYIKSVEILENSSKKKEYNWIYINTVLLLAKAYFDTGSEDLACRQYEKILEYEPAIHWIRDEMDKKCKDR